MGRRSLVQLILIGAVAGVAAAAVALFIPWLPPVASKEGGRIDFAFWFTTWICVAVFAVVAAVLVTALLDFRVPLDDDQDGPPIHGNTKLEIIWTAIPAILVTAISIVSAIVLAQNSRAGSHPLVVKVTAVQFAWKFSYPNGKSYGYLTLPKGLPAKNLPLIVHPHGGPWARDSFGYDTYAQFLSNRGYAVLQPNFRGSTGYGKKFLNAGNGEWGRKMQDDLTWGVRALVAEGLADPARIGITGGSYGGYATLAGVAFTPDVYAAAVAIVAPSNLITLLDAIPPYWEAGRKQMYTRMADPTTPAGKALLIAESPLTQAKSIVTPLLVVQGKNDPRVNIRESDQIVAAVRDNGKPVEYLVAPDEGHGFARPINNLAMVTAMEGFLAQYLGGRYQQEIPSDVAAKLKDITVDPRTVSGAVTLKGALAPPGN